MYLIYWFYRNNVHFLPVTVTRIFYLYGLDGKFLELLKYRFKRPYDINLCDIYDGHVYQERCEFFSNIYNVSFTLNYDGAPKFKSSNMQIWPIQMCLNELPPILR